MKAAYQRQSGQALVETLLSALAIVPFIVVLPHIIKVLDMKVKTHESARYVAHEQTVYRHGKSGLAEEAIARIQSEPGTRIQTAEPKHSRNRLWHRNRWQTLSGDDAQIAHSRVSSTTEKGLLLSGLINDGSLPLGFGRLVDRPHLNVPNNGLVIAESTMTVMNLPRSYARNLNIHSDASRAEGDPLTMRSRFALLTDTWMPESESEFARRIQGLSLDKSLGTGVAVGCLYSYVPLFSEGKGCTETDLKAQSNVMVNRYLDRGNARARRSQ